MGRVVAPAEGFVDWCVELLSPLGTVRARPMFGDHGLYLDERFVAIAAGEELYLKPDADSALLSLRPAARPSPMPPRGGR